MTEIGSFEAKTHFSELLRRVTHEGERFVVTMRGKPVAVLGPVESERRNVAALGDLLEELRIFREGIAARGPILAPGESWKELAREGLE